MDEERLLAALAAVRAGRLSRRALLQRLTALGVAAPLAGGGWARTAQAAPPAAEPTYAPRRRGGGGPLRLLFWQTPTLLNPHFANGSKDRDAARLFYEPLIRYDREGDAVPVLAARLPTRANGGIAADGRSVTWTLKPGVSWHDGRRFGADDVVFNWQYATDPATAATTLGFYENVKSIDKLDDLSVRVVFERPSPIWDRGATVLLLPRHRFEAWRGARSREAPTNAMPLGTGPYRCTEFRPGDLVRGVGHAGYHMPNRPHFDSVEIKGGGDSVSAARAVLQSGEYDLAWNLQVEDEVLQRMESGGRGRLDFAPSGNVEYIQLNAADPRTEVDGELSSPKSHHPMFGDPAVRQALALLFDRQAIQRYVYGRTGVATVNILNNPQRYNSPNLKQAYDVAAANAVLDAAGWKRGSDGVRARGGQRLQLRLQTSINAVRQKVQAIYKQSCAKAGIELELKGIPPAVFFSTDVGNADTMGKFQADLQMYTATRTPDPDRYMQFFVSWEASCRANKWQGLNMGRWRSDAYDALYRASTTELDPDARAAQMIRLNDLVCRSNYVIPIVYRPTVNALANGLRAPLSGWDLVLSAIHDWYREG